MSLLDPFARNLEHFVYARVCALSSLAPRDRSAATDPDTLASPLGGAERLFPDPR
ncbi:MAG: hypothetical protein JO085_06955 [Acidimicrobiia bacterium]|nr:hypothetical protein [Acidimicrobiia bacterium]